MPSLEFIFQGSRLNRIEIWGFIYVFRCPEIIKNATVISQEQYDLVNPLTFFFFFKYGTLHEFACHPCAGAMLIFSVSFQF